MLTPAANRPILITGCSSGIGDAAATRLAGKGWTVYATARRPETLRTLAERGCRTLALDVTDESSMRAVVDEITSAHGAVFGLVNNAGYGLHGPVETLDMDELREQFETNVFGLVRLSQLVLPGMRERGAGRIVNLSSMGGRITLPGGGAYHASKYAVEAVSDALRFEVRGFGIGVSLIEPGPVKTRFGDTARDTFTEDDRGSGVTTGATTEEPYATFTESLDRNIASAYEGPMGRLASSPERVAKVIERAITSDRPRARYLIGPMSRTLVGAKRVLPNAAFDGMLRAQYDTPAPE